MLLFQLLSGQMPYKDFHDFGLVNLGYPIWRNEMEHTQILRFLLQCSRFAKLSGLISISL